MRNCNTFSASIGAKVCGTAENVTKNLVIVGRLFKSKKLVLPATDGAELLGKLNDVFDYIDSNFQKYGCKVQSQPTKETEVQVYEMVKDGSFAEIFSWFEADLNHLCLMPAQIKIFVQNHREVLYADGRATLFLFKVGGEFFVAFVSLYSGGAIEVRANHFSNDYVWGAEGRHRIVVPQLTP